MPELNLDTNILLALWNDEPSSSAIIKMLNLEQQRFQFTISSVVFIELAAHPNITLPVLNQTLNNMRIKHDQGYSAEIIDDCAKRFAAYAQRRREAGSTPKRLLADFLVGAHSLHRNKTLMTLDSSRYKQDFPELQILEPT